MKKGKNFFYRIDAGPFLSEVIKTPENERGKVFLQLAIDLVDGKGTFPYSKQIIAESKRFREVKAEAGRKGMQNRWLKDNTVITSDNTVITKAVITRSSSSTEDKPYLEIIEDLNQKGGFKYRVGESIKKEINGRLSEKFTKEDFFTVHTNMISKWKDDPKMSQYLRPKTLYCASNFQGYLNIKTVKMKTIMNQDGQHIQVPA